MVRLSIRIDFASLSSDRLTQNFNHIGSYRIDRPINFNRIVSDQLIPKLRLYWIGSYQKTIRSYNSNTIRFSFAYPWVILSCLSKRTLSELINREECSVLCSKTTLTVSELHHIDYDARVT